MRAKQTSSDNFRKFYFIYLAVIVIALLALFFYVRGVMVDYENNTADAYILNQISKAASGKEDLYAYLEENCFKNGSAGNAENRKSSFKALASSNELKIASSKTSAESGITSYEITAGGKPFLSVGMKENKTYTKLGILTMSDWGIEYCVLRNQNSQLPSLSLTDKGKYAFTVSYPEGFTLLIDGAEYTDQSNITLSEHPDFVYITPYTKTPNLCSVSLELSFEPEIAAKNNSGEVITADRTVNNGYSIPAVFASSKEAEELIASLKPLDRAILWSKFMTNDVGGANYGFDTVVNECGLKNGTNLYTLARNWSRNIDIRFVSLHNITSWTNESVTNCIKYNDNLYSCDTYIEKNMHLKTGDNRTDVFNNRMYFAKVDGNWYLIDMFSLAAE